jgi:hypothetical protein
MNDVIRRFLMRKFVNRFFVVLFIVIPLALYSVQGLCTEEKASEAPFEDTIEALINLLFEKGVIDSDEADVFVKRYRSGIPVKKEKGTVVTIIPEQKGHEYIEMITDDVNKEMTKDIAQTKEDLSYMTDELLTRSRLLNYRVDELERKLSEDVGDQLRNSSWANRIRWGGDIRLRYQMDFYDDENYDTLYDPDKNEIVNTTVDHSRYRYRVRIEVNADIMEKNPDKNMGEIEMGLRLATGNMDDPVSTNLDLSDYFHRDTIALDKAYIKWTYKPDDFKWGRIPQVTAIAGRFSNPWFFSNLVWDKDINFEGMALKLESDTLLANPLKGFFTVGAFPLQELDIYEEDKWLFGGQLGMKYVKSMGLSLKLAVSYYDFKRTKGEFFNDPSGIFTNSTEPMFRQVGNALFDINTDPLKETYALAADYSLFNITAEMDYDYWFPYHVIFNADYVKNVAFEIEDVARRLNMSTYPEETEGYHLGLTVGYPVPRAFGEWNASLFYKYIGGDAVLDAFTDSDFHLGGSNAMGWILGLQFGLSERFWLQGRWWSTNEVRGVPIAIDRLMLDLNANF